MKLLALTALASGVLAIPQTVNPGGTPGNRGKNTKNDLAQDSKCFDIIFIIARASTEPGNMGGSMGPIVCRSLREAYPDRVGCQGVGPQYTVNIRDNGKAKGTTDVAIAEASGMFKQATEKCPKSLIVFGGYRYELSRNRSIIRTKSY